MKGRDNMKINDQLSRYQAEFYVETAHDAYVNVQRLLNDYNFEINSITDAIEDEKVYRRHSKKLRMKKFGARFLWVLGFINVLVTIVLLALTGYAVFRWQTETAIKGIDEYYKLIADNLNFEPLFLVIIFGLAYLLFLIITCKIFSRRRKVGRKLNIRKAKKNLKRKIKAANALTEVLTTYPIIYEEINKVLIKTKRHPLGKIIIVEEDLKAVEDVKKFRIASEEATKAYSL